MAIITTDGVRAALQPALPGPDAPKGASPAEAFARALEEQIESVNGEMRGADALADQFVRGEGASLHEVMIAGTKADISFRMMTTVVKKVVEAYQDVLRMQV